MNRRYAGVADPALYPADVGGVELSTFGMFILSEAFFFPPLAEIQAESGKGTVTLGHTHIIKATWTMSLWTISQDIGNLRFKEKPLLVRLTTSYPS